MGGGGGGGGSLVPPSPSVCPSSFTTFVKDPLKKQILPTPLAPVVRKPDNFVHWIYDKSLSSAVTYSVWWFWRDFRHRPMIHILLPLFCVRFIWLRRVFRTSFIYWIAAYPLDNANHPLNNWGLLYNEKRKQKKRENNMKTTAGQSHSKTHQALALFTSVVCKHIYT